jgi:hypothetical protein
MLANQTIESISGAQINCGDPLATLNENVVKSSYREMRAKMNTAIGLVWAVEGIFLAEIGIGMLILMISCCAGCSSRNFYSCSEWGEEFSALFKLYKTLN